MEEIDKYFRLSDSFPFFSLCGKREGTPPPTPFEGAQKGGVKGDRDRTPNPTVWLWLGTNVNSGGSDHHRCCC